jgi:ParB family chromosome partitioning protein
MDWRSRSLLSGNRKTALIRNGISRSTENCAVNHWRKDRALTEGGVLTTDLDLLRQAARKMLIGVLSCRENRSQSGPFARIAGEAIGASLRLPNMATEEFLSCLSRGALETVARAESVNAAPRAKDTRARMVARFKDGTFVYPGALFRLTPEELAAAAQRRHSRSAAGWINPVTGEDGGDADDDSAEPETGDEDGFEREAA